MYYDNRVRSNRDIHRNNLMQRSYIEQKREKSKFEKAVFSFTHNMDKNLLEDKYNDFEKGVLFYPCCSTDLISPIKYFSHLVKEFWFVDKYRYHNNERHFRRCRKQDYYLFLDQKIDYYNSIFDIVPALRREYRRLSYKLWIPSLTVFDENHKYGLNYPQEYMSYHWSSPIVFTEILEHKITGNIITTNLRSGDAIASLYKDDFKKISVFFYRGDSDGEGGSGLKWFLKDKFKIIVEKMINGGLIVTDGSNQRTNGSITKPLLDGWSKSRKEKPAITELDFDINKKYYKLKWVGYIDKKYGETLVWQLFKK
ncbi:MAG: hypothetical protein M0Q94_10575 [Candidatus Cloacimonetes bacterium]|nr:hypothetical protein [Candidatus Cloacimonadota bacterium]